MVFLQTEDTRRIDGLYIEDYSQSMGNYLSNVAGDAFENNPLTSAARMIELEQVDPGTPPTAGRSPLARKIVEERHAERIAGLSPYMTAEAANDKYRYLGLKFEKPIRERYAEILAERKTLELKRQRSLVRAPGGVLPAAAAFGTSFVVSAIDPANIAASFIPVFGQTRFAALAGRVGVNTARVTRGAVEGTVGAAVVEPIILASASQSQRDYTLYDSFLNVTIGAALGSGLHFASGKLSDIVHRKAGTPSLKERIEAASPQTKQDALRAAVASEMQGVVADVEPVFRLDPNFSQRQRLRNTTSLTTAQLQTDTGSLGGISSNTEVAAGKFDATAPEPELRLPVTDEKGTPRVYADQGKAERAITRAKDPELTAVKNTDGTFSVQRKSKATMYRNPDGSVKVFKNTRRAKAFVKNQLDGDPEFTTVPFKQSGVKREAIVRNATPEELKTLEKDFDKVKVTTPPRQEINTPAETQRSINDAIRHVTNPDNIRVASREASSNIEQTPTIGNDIDAISEELAAVVDELNVQIEALGVGDDVLARTLAEADADIAKADDLGRGYEAAVLCRMRT